ncbi:MAG: DUF4383 domain-containing protein [Usitatibacter sp.]
MKIAAVLAGVFFLLLGIAGFVPSLSAGGEVFGIFPANTMISMIYIIAGAAAITIGRARHASLTPPAVPGGHDLRDFGI